MEHGTEWREQARSLLRNRPVTLTLNKIAEETGLSVGWLRAFGQGAKGDPTVGKIEKLTKYLKNI